MALGSMEQFWSDPARAITRPPESILDITELNLVPPVPPDERVLCVGLNHPQHAAEGTSERPTHPSVFGRWTRSLTGSGTPAPVPTGEQGLGWEASMLVIGPNP